jgi:hypothetical protein
VLRKLLVVAGLSTILLAGCGSPASPEAATSSTTASDTPSASSTSPTPQQWCASYSSLAGVLAQSGSDAASATKALQALERFDLLWGIADNMSILSTDEVDANQRAVARYRAVLTLVANGKSLTSPEVVAARKALETSTTADRVMLKSSAGKVLGRCGAASATPSASAS